MFTKSRSTVFTALFLVFSGTAALASDAASVLAEIAGINRSKHDLSATLQINLAKKRAIETRILTLESEAVTYQARVASDSSYCSGTYQEPEYSRRVVECANRQATLDEWSIRLVAQGEAIDRDEAARAAEAQSLYARHLALEERLADALRRLDEFTRDNEACTDAGEPEDVWRCMCQKWDACG